MSGRCWRRERQASPRRPPSRDRQPHDSGAMGALVRPKLYQSDVQRMARVSVSQLRQHLPAYLKRVQQGESLQIPPVGA